MKNRLFLITFILIVGYANAQNKSFDQRLLSKFSKSELDQMQINNPVAFAYWNFYVATAYQVLDLSKEKANKHETKGAVKIKDFNTINIFDLNCIPLEKDYQYFKIEGTKKLLVILPEELIKENFVSIESDVEDESYTYEGKYVEIDKALKDNIVLNLPMKQLCKKECKGLCPKCGKNLNETACDCKEDDINLKMEALKDFFN